MQVWTVALAPLPLLLPVPLLSPWLSSLWLTLVTDIDAGTGRNLIDSMTNEVVVRDQSIRDLVALEPDLRADGEIWSSIWGPACAIARWHCGRPDARDLRWMVEELRVSLFAQTIGTPVPVSEKRIGRELDRLIASS